MLNFIKILLFVIVSVGLIFVFKNEPGLLYSSALALGYLLGFYFRGQQEKERHL